MNQTVNRIASFEVDHDKIDVGIYISRIDGDITTYDLRTRIPNDDDYIDDVTMHSVEHMLATYLRNSSIGSNVIYFGPMGCQTGFYLLIRNAEHNQVLNVLRNSLRMTIEHEGAVFGAARKECGNYLCLDLECAKNECRRYLKAIENWTAEDLSYPQGE